MNLLGRYILKNHVGPFLFGTSTVMFLFLFQFLLKYIDQLVGKGLSYWVIIQLISYNLSWMLVLAIPMGVLFSTLMAFGGMSASHEVTIIKASGGSLFKMMSPVLIVSILLTIFLFWFNDEILPEANHRAKTLMSDITRKKPTFSIEAGQFSNELDGLTILARSVDSLKGTLKGVTIYDNRNSENSNIISADTGIIEFSYDQTKLIMHLFNGEIHQLKENETKNYRIIAFNTYKIMVNADGFSFDRSNTSIVSRGDREMHIRDMQLIVNEAKKQEWEVNKKIKTQLISHYEFLSGKQGHRPTDNIFERNDTTYKSSLKAAERRMAFMTTTLKSDVGRKEDYKLRAEQYLVEIQKKYSIPFACIIFVLVGCPLGIITKGGNFGFSAAISLAFYVVYWACLIGGEKLADRGLLSPFMSMWIGNFIIGGIGLLLTIKVNSESLRIPYWKQIKQLFLSRNKTA